MNPASPKHLPATLIAVLLLHGMALSWLKAQVDGFAPLVTMAEPIFTRLLEQAVPPVPVPPSPTSPTRPARAGLHASHRTEVLAATMTTSSPLAVPDAEVPAESATGELGTSPAPQMAPDPPLAAASGEPAQAGTDKAIDPLAPRDSWPADTRLTYVLSGYFRGELHGSARVQWQRAQQEASYQVRLDLGATGFTLVTMTSQGEVSDSGLMPRAYEEKSPNGIRRVAFEGDVVRFDDGRRALQPSSAQDTASQFVEFSHRFASGRSRLEAGASYQMWLARPGGIDLWTYDVVKEETLNTASLGPVKAFHLRPRALANPRGPITAELWFAPSLQYLPVRVRIALGGDNFVDLLIERIEQGAEPHPAPGTSVPLREP